MRSADKEAQQLEEAIEQGIKDSYEVPNNVLRTMPQPLVTVRTSTYQHGPYIRECIEGVLMQRTTFPVEFIIGEDFSTDGTREIVMEYAAKHPDRIRVITADRNVGMRANGRRCQIAARGRYMALCEGDDHWIDPLKLQRQVDALEADPHASGCFTNAYNEGANGREPFLGRYTWVPEGPTLDEEAYLRGQGIPTCTFVYPRELINVARFKEVARPFATGDTALFTYLIGKGHFIYQPFFTGVRVMHEGGIYAMRGKAHKLHVRLVNSKFQDQLSGGRHSQVLAERRRVRLRRAWAEAMSEKDWELAREAWPHLARERGILGWSVRMVLQRGLMAYFPKPYDAVRSAWKRIARPFNRMRGPGSQRVRQRAAGQTPP